MRGVRQPWHKSSLLTHFPSTLPHFHDSSLIILIMIIIIITIISVMTGQKKTTFLSWLLLHGCPQKNGIFGPQKGHFGQSGHETARQAAKRPPTGKPKVFSVTSGYGGLMIPLSRVRLSPEKVGYVGVALKNQILRPILSLKHVLAPPRSLPGIMINMKTLSFWCSVIIEAKILRMPTKKWIWAPKGPF